MKEIARRVNLKQGANFRENWKIIIIISGQSCVISVFDWETPKVEFFQLN